MDHPSQPRRTCRGAQGISAGQVALVALIVLSSASPCATERLRFNLPRARAERALSGGGSGTVGAPAAAVLEPSRWLPLAEKGMVHFRAGELQACIKQLQVRCTPTPVLCMSVPVQRNHGTTTVRTKRDNLAPVQQAIRVGGDEVGHGVFNNLGIAHGQLGDVDLARVAFQKAVAVQPRHLDAYTNLAMLEAQHKNLGAASTHLHDALQINPSAANVWRLLGHISADRLRTAEAQHAYEHALALDPADGESRQAATDLKQASPVSLQGSPQRNTSPVAKRGRGRTRRLQRLVASAEEAARTGDHPAASQLYAQATKLQTKNSQLHMSYGTEQYWSNDMNGAAHSYRLAAKMDPSLFKARIYAGRALHEARRYEESRQEFRMAISVEPYNWEGYNMLGSAVMNSQNHSLLDVAVESYIRAGELSPRNPAVLVNLGHAFREGDRLEEARVSYSRAVELIESGAADGEFANQQSLADGLRIRVAGLVPRVIQADWAMLSHRATFIRNVLDLRKGLQRPLRLVDPTTEVGGVITFNLNYMGFNDRRIHESVARLYESSAPHLLYVAPHCHSPAAPNNSTPSDKWTAATNWSAARTHYYRSGHIERSKRRIGFVSNNLKDHTIGKLFAGTVVHLDRNKFEVVLFVFSGSVDHKSTYVQGHDGRTVILPYKLDAARRTIADSKLDILFYPDVGLDVLTYFLAFARLAPVQAMAWGHPVTSGSRHMDYFVSSAELEPPDGDDEYTEAVVRLPHIPVYFERPTLPQDLFESKRRRSQLFSMQIQSDDAKGLVHLYVCPQSLFKFHPDFDAAVAQILLADPRGRFVIIHASSTSSGLLNTTLARLHAALLAAGVGPAIGRNSRRVLVLPHQSFDNYLRLCASADVLLDTFPFGGGNSHYEALVTHTPVVTLRTKQMRGRITYALYHRMGMAGPEYGVAARSVTEYIQMAVKLGINSEANAVVRAEIGNRVDVLYGDLKGIRDLENWMMNVSILSTPPVPNRQAQSLAE
jgi:protein O-GlcNAc transferase